MATNWDLYETRLGISGNTQRDRNINKLKSDINSKIISSPFYQAVTYNEETSTSYLIILETDDDYIKKINSLPSESFAIGDIVNWKNQHWLITSVDCDDTVDISGEMYQCNYNLKFLDVDGHPASRYCFVENATQNTSGIKTTNAEVQMTLGAARYTIKLAFDAETILLIRDRRLLIDGIAYKITHTDRVSNLGCIILTLGEDAICSDDNLTLGIANYYSEYNVPTTTPVASYVEIVYSGDAVLYVGSASKTFMPLFKTSLGVDITPTPTALSLIHI